MQEYSNLETNDMKNIKNLTCYFRDLNEEMKCYQKTMRRLIAFEKYLEYSIPGNIKGKYMFSGELGETCPRCFIYLNKDETSTINLLKWLPELKKNRFIIEKFWRKESGYFAYRAERKYKSKTSVDIGYLILIEETANIDGCVIKEKRVMTKIFTTNCEKENVLL
jgi:hypothetical protein